MIVRCEKCVVSLQFEEAKAPGKNFTIKCPRCGNLVPVSLPEKGSPPSIVQQLETNTLASPVVKESAQDVSVDESKSALRLLLNALKEESSSVNRAEQASVKPHRVLLCLGERRDAISAVMVKEGYQVYIAQTPAQASKHIRDGNIELLIFSPDFASEFGGAAILQQQISNMLASERRRLFVTSVEDGGTTMNAHEAFLRNLNLIVNSDDINKLPLILSRALEDFNNLYVNYNKATGAEAL